MPQNRTELRGQDILCFAGEDWWMHNPHSNLHLMQSFSKANRILYVSSIGVKAVNVGGDKFLLKKVLKKLKSFGRYFKEARKNIFVLTPFALPVLKGREERIRRWNNALLHLQVSWALKRLRMDSYIEWVCSPVVHDVALKLRDKRCRIFVYYCVDNVSYVEGGKQDAQLAEWDESLQKKADLAFFVNRKLMEERKALNPETHHLGHGVDYEHFAVCQDGKTGIPEEMKAIPQPIAGYMGIIRGLDTPLIEKLARSNPGVSFVFVGDVYMDVSPLKALPNVSFLGRKTYDVLPRYLNAFACNCLFYEAGDVFNEYRNPKKLIEYLATGKPVVSLPNLELNQFKDLVQIAADAEEFGVKMRQAIAADEPASRAKRIAYAASHTWDEIARQAAAHILRLMR
jgi:glycosyltransferase involved in cell wall biosynthesis